MPATYQPSAMPSRPAPGSPDFALAYAARRFFEISSMAFRWNVSNGSQAPFAVQPSMACVSASVPSCTILMVRLGLIWS